MCDKDNQLEPSVEDVSQDLQNLSLTTSEELNAQISNLQQRLEQKATMDESDFSVVTDLAEDPQVSVRKMTVKFVTDMVESHPEYVFRVFPIFDGLLRDNDKDVCEEAVRHAHRFVDSANQWLRDDENVPQDIVRTARERIEELHEIAHTNIQNWEAELCRAETLGCASLLLSLSTDELDLALKKSPRMQKELLRKLKSMMSKTSRRDSLFKYSIFKNFISKFNGPRKST